MKTREAIYTHSLLTLDKVELQASLSGCFTPDEKSALLLRKLGGPQDFVGHLLAACIIL
jgi:hypothetical protein